jgi:hypothetical protein
MAKSTEEERRKKAYKLYKHNEKPTRKKMCLIVDALDDAGISRQDIDLLPWNLEKTKVIKEEMKALKEKKADKRDKGKEVTPTEEERRKKAYKLYKHSAKPTRKKMYLIVDALDGTGISLQDIDLLPWNLEKTKVIKEEMKALKEKKADKKDKRKEVTPTATPHRSKTEMKKDKEREEKEREREEKEDEEEEVMPAVTPYRSKTKSFGSGSDDGGQDFTRFDNENGKFDIGSRVYAVQDMQHRSHKTEEEHKRKREKRRREKEEANKKSELAREKSKAEADERDKKEKEKRAKEFAPKFVPKIKFSSGKLLRQERDASYDSGVEDFTKFESKSEEYAVAHGVYAEQKRTYSVNEELERKREELRRKQEERRRLREEEKEKSMPKAEDVTKARYDDSLELTFQWYTRMAMPSREEFKRQIEIQRVEITTEDVDLLEWNAAGTRVTNISAMNNKIRARMIKKEAKKAPASQRRRQ